LRWHHLSIGGYIITMYRSVVIKYINVNHSLSPVEIVIDLSTTCMSAMTIINEDLSSSDQQWRLLREYIILYNTVMVISRQPKTAATAWSGTLRSRNLIDAKIVLTFNLHPCVWLLIKYIHFVSFPCSHRPPHHRYHRCSTAYMPVMAGESAAAAHEVISMGTVINHK